MVTGAHSLLKMMKNQDPKKKSARKSSRTSATTFKEYKEILSDSDEAKLSEVLGEDSGSDKDYNSEKENGKCSESSSDEDSEESNMKSTAKSGVKSRAKSIVESSMKSSEKASSSKQQKTKKDKAKLKIFHVSGSDSEDSEREISSAKNSSEKKKESFGTGGLISEISKKVIFFKEMYSFTFVIHQHFNKKLRAEISHISLRK